jgi:hypothetical protein
MRRRKRIKIRGGDVPQDRLVPAWTSTDFYARPIRAGRISESTPAAPLVQATGEVLSRIKAVVHGLRHPHLKKPREGAVSMQRSFKRCFEGL